MQGGHGMDWEGRARRLLVYEVQRYRQTPIEPKPQDLQYNAPPIFVTGREMRPKRTSSTRFMQAVREQEPPRRLMAWKTRCSRDVRLLKNISFWCT